MDDEQIDELARDETLEQWVLTHCQEWRNHYETNYAQKHDEYYRLWRGQWAEEDKTRQTERSKIISPALQQAVESSVAEIEEATFGRGKWFEVSDDYNDKENADVKDLRNKLTEDLNNAGVKSDISECLLNAAVFGNGIAEVVLEEVMEQAPATQPIQGSELQAVGVNITPRMVVKLRPIMPRNFLIDPAATSITGALGCASDEFVPLHQIHQAQEEGIYRKTFVGNAPMDTDIEADNFLSFTTNDRARLLKYSGLVPKHLLDKAKEEELEEDEEIVELSEQEELTYVEACVVIANEGVLLKAEENPYMMEDRLFISFPWDITPGVFWGRGVCEKGYNSQKALDTELRARIDALALTIYPMLGVDATRIPRGHKPEVRPGKMLLTNGDPREVLHPFNFGNVDQITFAQASELQKMVQMATGAVDSAGIAGSVNGEATAAGISMSLGAIIKRQKRTLINFQESFLIPFVKKAAYRFMQFDPEQYPAKDFKFSVASSLGIMAREYEVTQLVQLLNTTSPESPIYPTIVEAIIENMNLSNREDMVAQVRQAAQPTPEQQQAQMAAEQRAQEQHQAQVGVFTAQANESNARAKKYNTEAAAVPRELEIKKIEAITTNLKDGDKEDIEFERRLKIADRALKEKEINIKEKQVDLQNQARQRNEDAKNALNAKLAEG